MGGGTVSQRYEPERDQREEARNDDDDADLR